MKARWLSARAGSAARGVVMPQLSLGQPVGRPHGLIPRSRPPVSSPGRGRRGTGRAWQHRGRPERRGAAERTSELGRAMPLRIRATDAEHPSDLLDLAWGLPLEQWPDESLVALPRGISRHVVRFARAGDEVVAIKEVSEWAAEREYGLLKDLDRLGIPAV